MNYRREQAFTIVELLIVIVVIAILAAITIVAYNGINARARVAAAQSTAASVAKKAEMYNADIGYYPVGMSALTGAASTKEYRVTEAVYGGTLSDSTETNSLGFYVCGSGSPASATAITAANITGGRVYYRNYQTSSNLSVDFGTISGSGIACYGKN